MLEKVQERLVRTLSNARGESYEERLKDAGLSTSAESRRRGDALETFKTLNGFNQVTKEKWFDIEREDARRVHVLRTEKARLEIRRNFFNVRVAIAWSEIPDHVKSQTSINGFKNAYNALAKSTHTTEHRQ